MKIDGMGICETLRRDLVACHESKARFGDRIIALEAERDDYKKRLNPSFDYVDGQPVAIAEDEIDRLQAERDRLKELIYAKFEDIRTDGKTILDFYACWYGQDRNTISKLRAERDQLKAEVERLRKAYNAVIDLINSSLGVYGLHLNGDGAPWETLRTGGQFEEWLVDFDKAMLREVDDVSRKD